MPTPSAAGKTDGRVWAGLLTLYLVWGSTYLAVAVAVATIPPFIMAGVRFGLAGLILLTWSVVRRPLVRPADEARVARQRDHRNAPHQRRHGTGRLRRGDGPVRHH